VDIATGRLSKLESKFTHAPPRLRQSNFVVT
jgi:hypothetical protein